MATTTLKYRLLLQSTQFKRAFSRIQVMVKGIAQRMKDSLASVGLSFAALATIGRRMLKPLGGFERAMVRVGAVSRATDSQLKALNSRVLSLAGSTEWMASQVADAAGSLGMKGFDADEIAGALPGVLQLASANQTDLAESAAIASSVLRSQGRDVSELAQINDVLTAATTRTSMNLQSIAEGMKHAGSVGHSFRVDLEEIVAALGSMNDQGVPAAMAGTALKVALPRLAKASTTTGKAGKAMEELGLASLSAAKKGFPTLIDAVETLEQKLADGMDQSKMNQYLFEAFGERAGPQAWLTLLNTGSKKLRELSTELKNSGGTAKRIADAQLNTFAGRMQILASKAEGLAITLGSKLAPIIERIGGALGGAMDWFRQQDGTFQQMVVDVGVLTAGILGALTGLSALVTILGPIMSVMGSGLGLISAAITTVGKGLLTLLGAPLIKVLGIAAALFGVFIAYKQIPKKLNPLTGFFDDITWSINYAVSKLSAFTDKIDGLASRVKDFFKVISGQALGERLGKNYREGLDERHKQRRLFQIENNLDRSAQGKAKHSQLTPEEYAKWLHETALKMYNAEKKGLDEGKRDAESELLKFNKPIQETLTLIKKEFAPMLEGLSSGLVGAIGGTLTDVIGKDNMSKFQASIEEVTRRVNGLVEAIKKGTLSTKAGGKPGANKPTKTPQTDKPKTNRDSGLAIDLDKLGKKWIGAVTHDSKTGDSNGFEAGEMLSKIGPLAGIIDTLMSSTSILGAVIGILIELLMSASAMGDIIDVLTATIGDIGDTLNLLLEPLKPIFGGLRGMVQSILKPLGPTLSGLGEVLKPIGGLLISVGGLFELIGVLLHPFVTYLGILAEVIEVIVRVISFIVKVVIGVIAGLLIGLGEIWNGIVGFIADVFREIGNALGDTFGGWAKDLANEIDKGQVDLSGLHDTWNDTFQADSFEDWVESTWDKTEADQEAAEALGDVADAANEAAEAFKNLPEGYKIAQARFDAMDGKDSSLLSTGTTKTGFYPERAVYNYNFENLVLPSADTAELMEDLKRERLLRHGVAAGDFGGYVGG